jgi:predicted AlkP superfamily phosphohydrolase/phosphomutase
MSAQAPARLVMLGIDAANPALLERWAADGTLPNLAALIARGVVAHTEGVEGFFVGSTWPTMYTGTSPASHGVHYLLQLVPGTYRLHWVANAEFVRRQAFWTALSRAGRRVAVLDVPLTRMEHDLNGVQVVEWGGHDSLYGFRATPDDLASSLRARHGDHPLGGSCDRSNRTAEDYANFVGLLEAGVQRKAAWTAELLARGGWDLFIQVFTESHCAGHQCWHLHDPHHPAHDAAFVAAYGDPLRRVYCAIDAAIGEVLAQAGEARVIVFTAHGMAHRYGAQFLLRDILVRLGVTVPDAPAGAGTDSGGRARRISRWVWHRLPESVRRSIQPLRRIGGRATSSAARTPSLRVDVERSRCFPVGNGLAVGGIRLNLAGREPNGVLEPGAVADEFCAQLSAELIDLVDDRTGRPLVRRVVRTSALYAGDRIDALPDLLVEWDDATPLESAALGDPSRGRLRARSDTIGVVEGVNDYARTGEHRPGGWMVAAGPGIAAGSLDRTVSLLDLAPTACAMLGVEIDHVDGRPIPELARVPAEDRRGNH